MKRDRFLAAAAFFFLSLGYLLSVIDFCCFDRSFYNVQYEKNQTVSATGLSSEDLNETTEVLLGYLRDTRDTLDHQAEVYGKLREVFDEREKAHMVDVKALYQNALMVRNMSLVIGLGIIIVLLVCSKQRKQLIYRGFCTGVPVLLLVILAILLYAAIDFDQFWINFHHTFFTNDLWLLDPNTEVLINMVPEPFFQSLVLRIIRLFLIPLPTIYLILRLFKNRWIREES